MNAMGIKDKLEYEGKEYLTPGKLIAHLRETKKKDEVIEILAEALGGRKKDAEYLVDRDYQFNPE